MLLYILCIIFQSSSDVSFLLRVLNLGVSAWEMISNQHFTEIALVSFQNLALVFILHLRNLHVKLAEQVQTTHTCICTSCSFSIILLSVAFITALFTFGVVKEKYLLGLEKLKFDKIISMLESIKCFTNGSLLVCACLVMDALEKAISLCDSYASLVLSKLPTSLPGSSPSRSLERERDTPGDGKERTMETRLSKLPLVFITWGTHADDEQMVNWKWTVGDDAVYAPK